MSARRKNRRPRGLATPGPKVVGARRALLPMHTVGRPRFRGPCAPRRHSPRQSEVAVSWRDRSNRCRLEVLSEASSPGAVVPCRERPAGRGADMPASAAARRRLTTGTAPAGGRPLAPCYGSDLWSLRLRSPCSWATRFVVPPKSRSVAGFAHAHPLPATASSFHTLALSAGRGLGRGSPAGKRHRVLVCAVAAITLRVTASAGGSKPAASLTRLARGF